MRANKLKYLDNSGGTCARNSSNNWWFLDRGWRPWRKLPINKQLSRDEEIPLVAFPFDDIQLFLYRSFTVSARYFNESITFRLFSLSKFLNEEFWFPKFAEFLVISTILRTFSSQNLPRASIYLKSM